MGAQSGEHRRRIPATRSTSRREKDLHVARSIYIASPSAGTGKSTVALGLIPAILCALGAVLLIFGYKLTREKIAQCQAEIDRK